MAELPKHAAPGPADRPAGDGSGASILPRGRGWQLWRRSARPRRSVDKPALRFPSGRRPAGDRPSIGRAAVTDSHAFDFVKDDSFEVARMTFGRANQRPGAP